MWKVLMIIAVIILPSISFAQKMTLDVRDYFTKKRIEFDSINFYNAGLGINKTLSSSTFINVEDLFIPTDVKKEDNVQVTLINNQLNINSHERILSVCLFDILGREILKEDVNNLQYHKSISSEFNSLFYLICIKTENGIYNSKLVNTNYQNLQTPNVMPASEKWIITVYKYSYNDKVIETDTLPDSLQIKLERIPLKVTINSTFKPYTRVSNNLVFNGNNFDVETTRYEVNEEINYRFSLAIFDTNRLLDDNICAYDGESFKSINDVYCFTFNITDKVNDIAQFSFWNLDHHPMGPNSDSEEIYYYIKDFSKTMIDLYNYNEKSILFDLSNQEGGFLYDRTEFVEGMDIGGGKSSTNLSGTMIIELEK